MYETRTQFKLSWWPSPQDYNEAIQNLHLNLRDGELREGRVETGLFGLPRPVSGAFASVYRVHCGSRDLAVRCFLHKLADQEHRYDLIADFVKHNGLQYTASFDFLKEGIKVNNSWFPLLKMEWVDGVSLDRYVSENITDARAMESLCENFKVMCNTLTASGIAHGDLQHGNILVSDNQLRLVDYDGMYVPEMKGYSSNELGHRNYQHPGRLASDFGPNLDNFSAWVIYASLRAFQLDSALFEQLAAGDDCLLFRQGDFRFPLRSSAFNALEKHEEAELRKIGRFLRAQLAMKPEEVPALQEPVPDVKGLEPIPEWVGVKRTHESAAAVDAENSAWLQDPTGKNRIQPPAALSVNADKFKMRGKLTHTLEHELHAPTPRHVHWNTSVIRPHPIFFQALMIVFPFLWLFFASFDDFQHYANLVKNGVYCDGTIEQVVKNGDRESNRSYRVSYKFYPGEDMGHRDARGFYGNGDVTVSEATASRLSPGRKIHVLVDPKDHDILSPDFSGSEDPAENSELAGLIFQKLVMVLALLVPNVMMEWIIWAKPLSQRWLAEHGEAVLAEILSKHFEQGLFGVIRYVNYRMKTGPYSGREIMLAVSDESYWSVAPGDIVTVLIDSRDPHHAALYATCLYQAGRPKHKKHLHASHGHSVTHNP